MIKEAAIEREKVDLQRRYGENKELLAAQRKLTLENEAMLREQAREREMDNLKNAAMREKKRQEEIIAQKERIASNRESLLENQRLMKQQEEALKVQARERELDGIKNAEMKAYQQMMEKTAQKDQIESNREALLNKQRLAKQQEEALKVQAQERELDGIKNADLKKQRKEEAARAQAEKIEGNKEALEVQRRAKKEQELALRQQALESQLDRVKNSRMKVPTLVVRCSSTHRRTT